MGKLPASKNGRGEFPTSSRKKRTTSTQRNTRCTKVTKRSTSRKSYGTVARRLSNTKSSPASAAFKSHTSRKKLTPKPILTSTTTPKPPQRGRLPWPFQNLDLNLLGRIKDFIAPSASPSHSPLSIHTPSTTTSSSPSTPTPFTPSVLLHNAQQRTSTWPASDALLFTHIHLRGFEPLLPLSWESAFPSIPAALFHNYTATSIPTEGGSCAFYHPVGTLVLRSLIDLGARVRELSAANKQSRAYRLIRSCIKHALTWGRLERGVSLEMAQNVVVVFGDTLPAKEPVAALERRALRKMGRLRGRWEDLLLDSSSYSSSHHSSRSTVKKYGEVREMEIVLDEDEEKRPSVYALILRNQRVAVVSLDTSTDITSNTTTNTTKNGTSNDTTNGTRTDTTRLIAAFDWARLGGDVWTALGIMLVALHAADQISVCLEGLGEKERGDGDGIERSLEGLKLEEDEDNLEEEVDEDA